MGFTDTYETIFRVVLISICIYHIFKHQFKIAASSVMIFAFSYLSLSLSKLFQIDIDPISNLIYLIFTFMAIHLGGSLKFYDKYKNWDRIVHALSGILFVGFGIAITHIDPTINKIIVLIFGFTFSISIHIIWEVLEYISDCLFHSNAQRWQMHHVSINHVSPSAIQPAGLVDTMIDTICCIIGSAIATFIWAFLI